MVPFPCSLFMSEATNELLAGAYNQEISAVLFPLYTLDTEEGAGSLLWGHRLKSSCKSRSWHRHCRTSAKNQRSTSLHRPQMAEREGRQLKGRVNVSEKKCCKTVSPRPAHPEQNPTPSAQAGGCRQCPVPALRSAAAGGVSSVCRARFTLGPSVFS